MTLRSLPVWTQVLLGVALAAAGFHLAADARVSPVRQRFVTDVVAPRAGWRPADVRSSDQAMESRVRRPSLTLVPERPDAYVVRLFYALEGGREVKVLLGGRGAGALAPARPWRKAIFRTPYLPKDRGAAFVFEVPKGEKLLVRRVDVRNYAVRIGRSMLFKPRGAPWTPYGAAGMGIFLLALAAAGALAVLLGKAERGAAARRALLGAGALGAVLALYQLFSPYPMHAVPDALAALFAGAVVLDALLRRGRGVPLAQLWPKLAAALGAAAIALAAAELTLRVWDPPISRPRVGSYIMYSPEYGWLNRPGAHGWQVDIGYHIRINRFGHRGPDYPEKKPAGVYRILGLGDSFTFGWGVEENQTFLKVLERRLRASGRRVQVLNAGVPAWHSSQFLHYLRREGMRFQPDLVVASFFIDDVFFKTVEEIRKGAKAEQIRAEEYRVRRQKDSFVHRIRLYSVWFNYRKLSQASEEQRSSNPYPTFEDERRAFRASESYRAFDRDPKLVTGLRKMLEGWRAAQDELGVPILITYIPPGGTLHQPDLLGPARALRLLCGELGLAYADSVSALERAPDAHVLYLHPRDGHMSAKGHLVVGEALARRVIAGGWLKPGR